VAKDRQPKKVYTEITVTEGEPLIIGDKLVTVKGLRARGRRFRIKVKDAPQRPVDDAPPAGA
jgi:hypothetical protein